MGVEPVKVFIALSGTIVLCSLTVLADVHIVAGDGSGDFTTIQMAISACNQGDSVFVKSGTYSSSTNGEFFPIIMTNGIVLQGEDPNTTIINGGATSTVLRTAANTTLSGFTIGGDGGGGEWNEVIEVSSSFTAIENNIILDNGPSYGIYCQSALNILITQNTFVNCGVHCESSDQITVSENVFNGMHKKGAGVNAYGFSGDIRNNLIQGMWYGIDIQGAAYVANNVVYNCMYGVSLGSGSIIVNNTMVNIDRIAIMTPYAVPIGNNIIMNVGDKAIAYVVGEVSYNNLWNNNIDFYNCSNVHDNIFADPYFADVNACDFHLKSQAGRWDPHSESWVTDEVTSPCIDAGESNSIEWQVELWPHGKRINMGAFGGTAQASLSLSSVGNVTDLNHDDAVDMIDWSLLADDWLDQRLLFDSDFDRDNDIDLSDTTIFFNNWLWSE